MTNKDFRFLICCAFIFLASIVGALFADNDLSVSDTIFYLFHPDQAESFDSYYYAFGTLPRVAVALIGGAILGLAGCVLQQLTQNPLTSPLTLGTGSGAWFCLVIISVFFPEIAAGWLTPVAFVGALIAFGLIVAITGTRAMNGITIVISGMVVNLLFGALSTAVVLLHSDFIQNVFLWGAGDLTQNGWNSVSGLLLKALPAILLLLIFAPRALALLSLGESAAKARGLPVVPIFIATASLAVWSVSAFITAAGVINFTGLIAPNIARALGFESPRKQLIISMTIGALLLLVTDTVAVILSAYTGEIVPTGVVSALIGTPLFIVIALRACRRNSLQTKENTQQMQLVANSGRSLMTFLILCGCLCLLVFFNLYLVNRQSGWMFALASHYELLLRLPRLTTALFAGASLAVAGVIMQRLTANPLASPDILGVSAGAVFAMIAGTLFFGTTVGLASSYMGLIGSLSVLAVLLLLSKASYFAPSIVILLGIAVSALLDSITALMLSRGTMQNYYILQWLSGSTYRTDTQTAVNLAIAAFVLIAVTLLLSRSLTLMSIGREFASSRGLSLSASTLGLLSLCALLCSIATAAMGPVAFVGLVAPHMAVMLGARTVKRQIVFSTLLGALLVGWADWLGQIIIAPTQIPAGTLSAIIGALYFLALLLVNRLQS